MEIARVDSHGNFDALAPDARSFFDDLKHALDQSLDKNLTVYVHGANNNFYRSSSQAAQYHHFTGRNSVVLVFSWPSAESLLRYTVDVHNAPETIPRMSKGSHSFWYTSPWVSTDVLIQFLFQARPAERGLAAHDSEKGVRVWYFPPDYPQRVSQAILRLKEAHSE